MKNKKEKITTDIKKYMNVEGSEMPEGLVLKLSKKRWYTYKDTNTLKEHFYDIEELQEHIEKEKHYLSLEEKLMINRIARFLKKKDCSYFRFVFNFSSSPF